MKRLLPLLTLVAALQGCTYLGTMMSQAGYSLQQMAAPEQRVYKHMLDRETFFVFGKLAPAAGMETGATAVVALSDRYRPAEVVDLNPARPDSHYGLNLPPGDYRLLLVQDRNGDEHYDQSEVFGGRALAVNTATAPDKVLGGFDLDPALHRLGASGPFRVAVPRSTAPAESVFYPQGSLRPLDDPLFSTRMAELGMYEPAAFLEQAPMMFYALEEDAGFKVPVVFVHGIGGSVRDFEAMIAALDRSRYRPWFFYYPSGMELKQSGAMFHRIFLSGEVIPLGTMPMVVVAHSMGGLVVREALNHPHDNQVSRLITIATPFGGHPAARSGASAPVVLPSWRDLDPDSPFVAGLHRKSLPAGLEHHLLFAYGNDNAVRLGANSDGVVPLASQLTARAQGEAAAQHGYDDTHTGVLRNREAVTEVMRLIGQVRPPIPEAMLREADKGGFDVELGPGYSPQESFYIRRLGHFLAALTAGALEPMEESQARFVRVARGELPPQGEVETGWVRFLRDCPERRLLAHCPGDTPVGRP